MKIRTEEKKDYKKIYSLIETAFKTAKESDGTEQDFAENLRNSENYIPSLALIAEENDEIIGHVMLTKNKIITKTEDIPTLLLAPLSVKLEYRDKGVGSALVKEVLKRALNEGHSSVFLVGDPAYYSRFGFKESLSNFNVKNNMNIPDKFVQAAELTKNALSGISGEITLA